MTAQNMTDQYLDPILVSGFLDRIEEASAPQDPDPSELPALVDRLAALPAPPGAVVVIALPNGIRALRFFFAVSLAGYTPVLLSPSTPVSRVREVARELGACALVRAAIRAEGVTGVTRGQAVPSWASSPSGRTGTTDPAT